MPEKLRDTVTVTLSGREALMIRGLLSGFARELTGCMARYATVVPLELGGIDRSNTEASFMVCDDLLGRFDPWEQEADDADA